MKKAFYLLKKYELSIRHVVDSVQHVFVFYNFDHIDNLEALEIILKIFLSVFFFFSFRHSSPADSR